MNLRCIRSCRACQPRRAQRRWTVVTGDGSAVACAWAGDALAERVQLVRVRGVLRGEAAGSGFRSAQRWARRPMDAFGSPRNTARCDGSPELQEWFAPEELRACPSCGARAAMDITVPDSVLCFACGLIRCSGGTTTVRPCRAGQIRRLAGVVARASRKCLISRRSQVAPTYFRERLSGPTKGASLSLSAKTRQAQMSPQGVPRNGSRRTSARARTRP